MNTYQEVCVEFEQRIRANQKDPNEVSLALTEFVSGDALPQLINSILGCAFDSTPKSLKDVGSRTIQIIDSDVFILNMKIWRACNERLDNSPADAFEVIKSCKPVTISVYKIEDCLDIEVFQPNVKLKLIERRIDNGTAIRKQKNEPIVIDYESEEPFITIALSMKPISTLVWLFDRQTHTSMFPVLTKNEFSALILLCKTMATMKERRAIPLIASFTKHTSHAVRWAAIQALGKLDREEAMSCLRKAVDDQHPHIRNAAQRILASNTR